VIKLLFTSLNSCFALTLPETCTRGRAAQPTSRSGQHGSNQTIVTARLPCSVTCSFIGGRTRSITCCELLALHLQTVDSHASRTFQRMRLLNPVCPFWGQAEFIQV
jgi:hypothetical protein